MLRTFECEQTPLADGLPSVTLGDVERAVRTVSYTRLKDGDGNDTPVTTCLIVMDNGHKVTGQSSCVHEAKFNAELGNKYAKERAMDEVWALLGYELRLKLNIA